MEETAKQYPRGIILINGVYYEVESYNMANGGGRRQATLKPIEEPEDE